MVGKCGLGPLHSTRTQLLQMSRSERTRSLAGVVGKHLLVLVHKAKGKPRLRSQPTLGTWELVACPSAVVKETTDSG